MRKMESSKPDSSRVPLDLQAHPLSGGDEAGRVFIYKNRIFRGVSGDAAGIVNDLFKQGIAADLIRRGFIPNTWISEIRIKGFPLVLEQELLPVMTYSYEWTFTMLRDAAELVLNFRDALNEYGYDLKDAHPDNIAFKGTLPIWIDICSIVRMSERAIWVAQKRYIQSFLYPLRIWSLYGEEIARRILIGNDYLSCCSAVIMLRPWTKLIGINNLKKLLRLADIYRKLYSISNREEFRRKISKWPWLVGFYKRYPFVEQVCYSLLTSRNLPFRRTSTAKLRKKLYCISKPQVVSKWKNYYDDVLAEFGSIDRYPRFLKVINILASIQPESVVEIGANQGLLSKLILDYIKPKRLILMGTRLIYLIKRTAVQGKIYITLFLMRLGQSFNFRDLPHMNVSVAMLW